MNADTLIQQIRQQIGADHLPQAMQQLEVLLNNSPQLSELLLHSARYADLSKQIRQGTISSAEANLSKNQLRLALLELVDEVAAQQQEPAIRAEMERAASIVNSKNIVTGQIQAGGNVQVGDVVHTESRTSRRLRLFLFLFLPVVVIGGTYAWYQNTIAQQPLQLKVLLDPQTTNAHLPGPVGNLTLTYGGKPDPKDSVRSEAIFENIPSNFRNEEFRLQYRAEGFDEVDTTFAYSKAITLPVYRNDELARMRGYIYEETTGEPLEGVSVSIDCCDTKTDSNGAFLLQIPPAAQRLTQRLNLRKPGYQPKSTTEPVITDHIYRIPLTPN